MLSKVKLISGQILFSSYCSVKTDLLKDGAVSRLYIARASKTDSGNYTCGMRNAQTSVTVHILNGEEARKGGNSRKERLGWQTFNLSEAVIYGQECET